MSDDINDFRLSKNLERALLKARKKAGRKIGRKFVKSRRERLGGASARRKKAVISRTGKEGSLVVYDMAPMAVSQEFGETIMPKNEPQLFIRMSLLQPGEKPVRRGDYLLATKPGQKPRLLGVYKDNVTIKKVNDGQSFFKQAESFADEYLEELEKEFDNIGII